jgi:hypothetical protein
MAITGEAKANVFEEKVKVRQFPTFARRLDARRNQGSAVCSVTSCRCIDCVGNCEFQKLGHLQDSKEKPYEHRHRSTLFVINEPRARQPQLDVPGVKLAAVRSQHILNPLRVATVSECDDKSIVASEHHHWRAVLTMSFPADVDNESHTRQPARQWAQQSIREVQVDARQPTRERHNSSLCVVGTEETKGKVLAHLERHVLH